MSQYPVIERLLPVDTEQFDDKEREKPDKLTVEHIYEPGIKRVLNELLPRFVEMRIYQLILESIASEQSARMVAMRNATKNAKDLVDDLTLLFNKARQDVITRELLDITAGKMALEQER
jgi:F-type H+-transporting ATPase subunit gamma